MTKKTPGDQFALAFEAKTIGRITSEQLESELASYAQRVRDEIDRKVADARERMRKRIPELEVIPFSGEEFLPMFIEYLQGKEYIKRDEVK